MPPNTATAFSSSNGVTCGHSSRLSDCLHGAPPIYHKFSPHVSLPLEPTPSQAQITCCQTQSKMLTRAQKAALDVPVANIIFGNVLIIRNEVDLAKYLNVTIHVKQFANAVAVLEVHLPRINKSLLPILRALLMRLPNVDTLCVNIPGLSPQACSYILQHSYFDNLICFQTHTLPHRGLSSFIKRNANLSSIILGRCGSRSKCITPPLQHGLEDIQGPSRCISTLIKPQTHRLVAELHTPFDSHGPLFKEVKDTGASIQFAVIHFSPSDPTLMTDIAMAMPMISTLRLDEIDTHALRPQNYPWTSNPSWQSNLRSLHRLKRFYLRTSANLVPTPGLESDEKDLIMLWISSATNRSLDEITFCYGLQAGVTYESVWKRTNKIWKRSLCVVNNL
ncbi:hypothetical protein BJ912DRAFT_926687 [Pholiota molesta]|nr:hypothetical protein BJ912DRAFT_926687 [Pholiota molesta]